MNLKCPECRGQAIKYGVTTDGRQRYKCKTCGYTFTDAKCLQLCSDTRPWCINKDGGRCMALSETYEKDGDCPFYKKINQKTTTNT